MFGAYAFGCPYFGEAPNVSAPVVIVPRPLLHFVDAGHVRRARSHAGSDGPVFLDAGYARRATVEAGVERPVGVDAGFETTIH